MMLRAIGSRYKFGKMNSFSKEKPEISKAVSIYSGMPTKELRIAGQTDSSNPTHPLYLR